MPRQVLFIAQGLLISIILVVCVAEQGHTADPARQTAGSGLSSIGSTIDSYRSTVLVLGSAGVVGRALVPLLKRSGHHVLDVPSRNVVDLRLAGGLQRFENDSIDFVFFLAAEASTGWRGSGWKVSFEAQQLPAWSCP